MFILCSTNQGYENSLYLQCVSLCWSLKPIHIVHDSVLWPWCLPLSLLNSEYTVIKRLKSMCEFEFGFRRAPFGSRSNRLCCRIQFACATITVSHNEREQQTIKIYTQIFCLYLYMYSLVCNKTTMIVANENSHCESGSYAEISIRHSRLLLR